MSKNRIVDAVGEVNDKYLSEALSYKPAKKSMYALPPRVQVRQNTGTILSAG